MILVDHVLDHVLKHLIRGSVTIALHRGLKPTKDLEPIKKAYDSGG